MALFEQSQDPDGLDAEAGPFGKPEPGRVVRWNAACNPRNYRPFLVEVKALTAASVTFWLLSSASAARLHDEPLTEDLNRADRICASLPSTAWHADPADETKRFAFLFVTDTYLSSLADGNVIDGRVLSRQLARVKWPQGSSDILALAAAIAIHTADTDDSKPAHLTSPSLFEASTDSDGLDAEADAFARPRAGQIIRWNAQANPHNYRPFLVEVSAVTDETLSFWLLDGDTAERTHAQPLTEKLHDATRIHAALPSTAQLADPADATKRYGFLFLTDAYIQSLGDAKVIDSRSVAREKWPRGSSI